ncbi:nitrate- and nitrite sensing domain-containing protein [Kitasatospora sp. NPDC088346]|uniref:nitrate- and nitrite sensing domain-containing protein n=1 Tax=Kitasatospora sp. NPDC088346 TaxID=3364073 RepID=UPI0038229439
MRLRSSSIRARIIALLMVPIVALTGLWVYATLVTTWDVWGQLDVSATYRAFGGPSDQYVHDLQAERWAAVMRVADRGSRTTADAYQAAQAATDRDLQTLRAMVDGADAGRLDTDQRRKFRDVLSMSEQLPGIRSRANQGRDGWETVITDYGGLVQPVFTFRSSFVATQAGSLARQGTVLVELTRAREFLSQEAVAMEALQLTANPDDRKVQAALDYQHSQQALYRIYLPELDPQDQGDFRVLQGGIDWTTIVRAERAFEEADSRIREVKSNTDDPWRENADRVLADLASLNSRLDAANGDRARSYAVNSLVRGGIAGAVGLGAVVASILISYRIGRKLARELVSLRNAALDMSGNRLPSVMLRLRRGESVDTSAEVLQLNFGNAEIGQVGRAFNEVQRVAVEAAVEQAELRRGVSAVFVNLARRSQVLLHRQLTLLDTMERRTEDPAELEDLFRLDHLTTRMRRHSEGLIILSGGSPGRAWRKPVRMVDVVRAAVGEVEDYARVIVRPFPGTGLLGSSVADVTHLIAELVENAAVFSPPHTQVTVQGEVVAHGFCLEIDDRGLGLSEQALQDINQRLAVEQEFDLADTDRLGLFVVSRLARRHGIRVHLRPSPYGGTSAVVLIPRELLAEATELSVDQVPAQHAPAPAGDGGHGRAAAAPIGGDEPVRGAPRRVGGGPRPSPVQPASTPGGLPRRRPGGGPVLVPADGATGRHRRTDSPVEEHPVPTSPAHAAPPVAGGLLPRRVRQANLAPQLKDQAATAEPAEPARERSPEEARATFASFQRGFQRGRGDRLQPASLTVVREQPEEAGAAPAGRPARPPERLPGPPRLRIALPSAPVPYALPAAPARAAVPQPSGPTPAEPVPPAAPAPPTASAQPVASAPPARPARPARRVRPAPPVRAAEPVRPAPPAPAAPAQSAPAEGTES